MIKNNYFIKNKVGMIVIVSVLLLIINCNTKDQKINQLEVDTTKVINAIQNKNSDAILEFIPESYKLEIMKNDFMTKKEIINDFKTKGRIYRLFFCGDLNNEEEASCIYEWINNQKVRIKSMNKIVNNPNEIITVFITWDEKEEAEKIKNIKTNYFDKLNFIRINNKWFLNDLKVWKNQL